MTTPGAGERLLVPDPLANSIDLGVKLENPASCGIVIKIL
jgi:hypothetical protein